MILWLPYRGKMGTMRGLHWLSLAGGSLRRLRRPKSQWQVADRWQVEQRRQRSVGGQKGCCDWGQRVLFGGCFVSPNQELESPKSSGCPKCLEMGLVGIPSKEAGWSGQSIYWGNQKGPHLHLTANRERGRDISVRDEGVGFTWGFKECWLRARAASLSDLEKNLNPLPMPGNAEGPGWALDCRHTCTWLVGGVRHSDPQSGHKRKWGSQGVLESVTSEVGGWDSKRTWRAGWWCLTLATWARRVCVGLLCTGMILKARDQLHLQNHCSQ
jgi:hypothetical protein